MNNTLISKSYIYGLQITICSILYILSGCASNPPKVIQVPFEVKVPVKTSCVSSIPESPVKLQIPTEDIFPAVQAMLIRIKTQETYSAQLEAVLEGCK
jgi:hypothetical protein